MEKKLNYDVLRMVFKYLSGTDLSNAAQVCRSWLGAANDENKTRGPLCIIRSRKRTEAPLISDNIKREMIECLVIKPTLSMFFEALEKEESPSESCHCKNIPNNSTSVSVTMFNSLMKEEDQIIGTFFPKIPNVEILTLTFNKLPSINGIYIEELKLLVDTCFYNAEQLKPAFEVPFNEDFHKTSCLILFYKYFHYSFFLPLDLLKCLKNWFPYAKTSIWGGGVKKLSVCSSLNNSSVCKSNVECVTILISGSEMQTWSLCLDQSCDTEEKIEDKFKVFKDVVKFKKHSVAFMFTSDIRGSFLYNLESTIFKRFFPTISLVEYFGNNAFGGEIFQITNQRGLQPTNNFNTTAFMILTYN